MSTTLSTLEKQIARLQHALAELGPMRPGALGHQYKDPKEKRGGYWQISYTHRMRSRSEYVRPEHLPSVRAELANFRKFRRLAERWVDLSLEVSRLKRKAPQPKRK